MTNVIALPGPQCTRAEARELTDRIKAAVEQTWAFLLEAHERRAWSALGYATWEEYVRGEFHMARRTSYQLLDQGRVIRAIAAATDGMCSDEHIAVTDAEARDIKPVVGEVAEAVRERVRVLPAPEPERVQAIVREEVEKARAVVRGRQEPEEEGRETAREVLAACRVLTTRDPHLAANYIKAHMQPAVALAQLRMTEDAVAELARRIKED